MLQSVICVYPTIGGYNHEAPFAVAIALGLVLMGISRAQFGPEPKYEPSEVTALVDQVHTDLNHAYGVWHFSSDDRERLNRPEKDSRQFAQKWPNEIGVVH
jgi:hypothetical protein